MPGTKPRVSRADTRRGAPANEAAAAQPDQTEIPAPRPTTIDEVTLAFATWVDGSGTPQILSEPAVQATILCSVDGERSRQRFVFQPKSERVQAVAPVYWPLRIFPSSDPDRVVIFDGTGVWKGSFQHSVLPPLDASRAELANPPSPAELAACIRHISATVRAEAGSDSILVEGLLPVEAPLFSDILSQSGLRTDPLPEHPGFLPTRHPIAWYETIVAQISSSLAGFDTELRQLSELTAQLETARSLGIEHIAADRRGLESELRNRIRFYSHAEMERGAQSLYHSIWEQTIVDLDRVRRADVTIAGARASAATAEELSKRAGTEGRSASQYRDRIREAHAQERAALEEIQAAREHIRALHERAREGLNVLTDRVAHVEQGVANDLAGFDLQVADIEAAWTELRSILENWIARKKAEREQLAAHLVALPNLAGVRTLWFPLWVAEMTTPKGSRFRVFPPMQLRTALKVGDSIRTLFGGLVLPLEPRTARFEQSFRTTVETALAQDPWLSTVMRQIVRAADATADADFLPRFALGLHELRQGGWITSDQERSLYASCAQHLGERPVGDSAQNRAAVDHSSSHFAHGS